MKNQSQLENLQEAFLAFDQGEVSVSEFELDRLLGLIPGKIEGKIDFFDLRRQKGTEQYIYEGTPYEFIREFLHEVRPQAEDIVYDLGSGYGRIPFYGALTTPASFKGIEIVPERVKICQRIVQTLKIPRVEFFEKNVLDHNFSDGTIFFLFNPFTVDTLAEVIDRLHSIALNKEITVVTWGGTSDMYLEEEDWLKQVYKGKRILIFESSIHGTWNT